MANSIFHFWTIRIAISIIMLLLLSLCVKLGYYFVDVLLYEFQDLEGAEVFTHILLSISNILLIALLLFFVFILSTVITNDTSKLPRFIVRYSSIPELDSLFNSVPGRSNLYLVLFASIVTLYSLCYGIAIKPQFKLSGIILLLFYFIRWHEAPNSGLPTFIYLLACLFICSLRIGRLQYFELFDSIGPFIFAVVLSLLFMAGWVLLKIRHIPVGSSSMEWHGSLIMATSILFIGYFQLALQTINCLYDPVHKNVIYTATVSAICTSYDNRYILCLNYAHKGSEHCIAMPVHPTIHQQVSIGDKLSVHLHPGLLGWPWYHDDIHTRYQ